MSSMPPHFNFNANIPTAAIGLLRIQIKFNDFGLVRLGRSGCMRTKVLHRGRNRVGKGDHDEAASVGADGELYGPRKWIGL